MPKKTSAKPTEKVNHKKGNPGNTDRKAVASRKDGNKAEEHPGFPIVGVGASAGGLEAFEGLLSALPANIGMAFVLVPHLAPKHESILTELLAKHSTLPVTEAADRTAVRPNHVYIIPPNADIRIEAGVLHLSGLPEQRGHRLPIDHFFRSLAQDQQSRAIGVILSGTASDGTLGLQAIKAQGGITFAQDEKSAKYSGMPRSAIATGIVDFVLPPDLIAKELSRIARRAHLLDGRDGDSGSDESAANQHLSKIFALLKSACQVDFALYKPATIRRRIGRRMFLHKLDSLEEYVRYMKGKPDEVVALFDDMLINVTGFFRDAEAFDALSQAFPSMMADKLPNAPIRVWVPGCSTGEEAYSMAISLLEILGDMAANTQIQVFATDVSDNIIQRARAGIYPENISLDLTPERLRRYFQKVDGGYQISKTIRDICVFAKQDITRDPPFSKIDLVSCRNVMIYMNQTLQQRIFPLFHYALNPGGLLFLGTSETVGIFHDLFSAVDKKHKIYSKRAVVVPFNFEFVPQFNTDEEALRLPPDGPSSRSGPDLARIADHILLNRYAPASVVVNSNLDIVQFIGNTGPFLAPMPGDASLNLLRMVKSGLHLELRLAFQKNKRDSILRREGVVIEHEGGFRTVNFEIIPVRSISAKEQFHIVVFEDGSKVSPDGSRTSKVKESRSSKRKLDSDGNTELATLREELNATREYLQSIIEEQRSSNEEQRSANEEIQSSNEELQSINEELETAKEELQSTNEELTTVNEELQNRNDELTQLNNDLNNLLSSVNIPIVMLGNDLRIRRFTPLAEKVMNLIPSDIGRPITDIKSNLKVDDLRHTIMEVIDTLKIEDLKVEDQSGRWYSMRIRPYRTMDNKIDGVVIVLLDLVRSKTGNDGQKE